MAMTLFMTPASPFARKVRITAIERGLADQMTNVVESPFESENIRKYNPLGKVPALVIDDLYTLIDSPAIVDYLNSIGSGPNLIPAAGKARIAALWWQALADGVMTAAVAIRFETIFHPEAARSTAYFDRQKLAITSALDVANQHIDRLTQGFDVGHIALGCALGYLDLRNPELGWREGRAPLAAWHEQWCTRPSAAATHYSIA